MFFAVTKESKVLCGRSLRVLAQEIEHGLTLAIYLDISDSAITGLGFDALASGQSLSEITYRILLLWKRQSRDQGIDQVSMLVQALEDMGRADVSKIVLEAHNEDQELTRESFGELHDNNSLEDIREEPTGLPAIPV